MPIADSNLNLLFLSALISPSEPIKQCFILACSKTNHWEPIPSLAEKHGVAPLLYTRLKDSNIELPPSVALSLKALALRHRLINRVHSQQVVEISNCLKSNEVQPVFLKGAALAHMLYPDPGLRPMSDIDLLVADSNLQTAFEKITGLGFSGLKTELDVNTSRHLPPLFKTIDGFNIRVELHFALLQDKKGHPWFTMNDLLRPLQIFTLLDGQQCAALGHEDMLFHLCQHAFYNNYGFDNMRLIWLADIINYAEMFSQQIDWDLVRKNYPVIIHTLSMLNLILPFGDDLQLNIGVKNPDLFKKVNIEYEGWPTFSINTWGKKAGFSQFISTLFPSNWWLQLHYGCNKKKPVWYHWGQHVLHLFWVIWDRLMSN